MKSKLQDLARAVVYPSYSIYRDFKRRQRARDYRTRCVASAPAGNVAIMKALTAGKPAAIGKIGSLELHAIREYLNEPRAGRRYQAVFSKLHHIAGIFPPTTAGVDGFCKAYITCLEGVDILAVWYNVGEIDIVQKYCTSATLIELTALEPYFHSDPWSQVLAGRRVLILHPFTQSIERQLGRRQEVWRDRPAVLPSFEAVFIKAPLSDGLVKSPHATWSAALEALKEQMEAQPFDVALLGAGAFSLPLCVHAKRLGKIGVHLGGATQILFGIRGGRWDSLSEFHGFFNEAWIRPAPDETPPNIRSVERGCYW
jgi:hypothetical protein